MTSNFLCVAISAGLLATSALAQPAGQWVYRSTQAKSAAVAVFLSWDYSTVLFRIRCDRPRQELVFDYFGDGEVALSAEPPMAISMGSRAVAMNTVLANGRLEGRVPLREDAKAILAAQGDLQIDAPNAMGEPWHVGKAGALRRVSTQCASVR